MSLKEQVINVMQKVSEIQSIATKITTLCSTALFTYEVGGQKKTLPDADIKALISDYQTLKAQLRTKVDALP